MAIIPFQPSKANKKVNLSMFGVNFHFELKSQKKIRNYWSYIVSHKPKISYKNQNITLCDKIIFPKDKHP